MILLNTVANALVLVSETSPPDFTETAPVKLFVAFVSVISFSPAVNVVVPVPLTESAPVCESSPPIVVRFKLPVNVDVPNISASTSV